jgi:hypothetical protein
MNSPKILGLDVSTKTIGIALFDIPTQELLELTHISPVPKPKTENKIHELINKSFIVRQKLEQYKDLGITKVIIEEPLLNSNNIYVRRNKYGEVQSYCQYVGDLSKFNSRKIIDFEPNQIAHLPINKISDDGNNSFGETT